MNAKNLRQDCKYIFQSKSGITVFKGKLKEVTEKTLLIEDLDTSHNRTMRLTKEDFGQNWNVLEELPEPPTPELPF